MMKQVKSDNLKQSNLGKIDIIAKQEKVWDY